MPEFEVELRDNRDSGTSVPPPSDIASCYSAPTAPLDPDVFPGEAADRHERGRDENPSESIVDASRSSSTGARPPRPSAPIQNSAAIGAVADGAHRELVMHRRARRQQVLEHEDRQVRERGERRASSASARIVAASPPVITATERAAPRCLRRRPARRDRSSGAVPATDRAPVPARTGTRCRPSPRTRRAITNGAEPASSAASSRPARAATQSAVRRAVRREQERAARQPRRPVRPREDVVGTARAARDR